MTVKKSIQILIVLVLLATTSVSTGSAKASYPCPTYYTVQWGDTLSGIAAYCGTTVYAIRAANPGLGWWVYAGQVIYIPTGTTTPPPSSPPPSYATYVVRPGDTLGKIAARAGTTVYAILAVNPQITNPNLIYIGQVIYMPPGVAAPPPPSYPPPPTYPTTPPTYPTVPPTYPTATPSTQFAYLWIDYEHGMYIRDMPNGNIIASALDGQQLTYRTNSVFQDSNWKVWVEVKLYPPTKGYYVGWLMVRDQFGTYFTNPRIAAP